MDDQYAGLDVSESEIYKLRNFATIIPRNLPPESHAKTWAQTYALRGKVGYFSISNNGGTAEAQFFRPYNEDE